MQLPSIDVPLLARIAICFLIGSVPFAMLSMQGAGVDIRQIGSGNPGFNNVLRVSKWRAILTLVGDLGKGALAIWLCLRPDDGLMAGWLYGSAAVLGHCYSPLLKFNGGKGIATSAGVMLMLYPLWALVAISFFVAVRLLGSARKWPEAGTIASLSTWVVFTGVMLLVFGGHQAAAAAAMTLFLAWRHKKNFQNLRACGPAGMSAAG